MKSEHIGFTALALLLVAGLLFAKFVGTPADAPTPGQPAAVTVAALTLTGVWVAEPIPGQANTAAYVSITNAGADERLIGVATPVGQAAHLHRTVVEGGVSRMESVDAVIIPSGGSVTFAPGGLHIMLMGLNGELAEGGRVPLTLRFLEAGDVTVDAPVRRRGAGEN